MYRLALVLLLAVAGIAVPEPAIGRSFPEANCGFSLPDKDWEWLDPKKAPSSNSNTLAFARNRTGVTFWLKVYPIAAGTAVGPGSYENWERQNAGKKNWMTVSSKHFEFKGVPAYQIDFRTTDTKASGRFVIVYADNRRYVLGLQTSHGEVGPDADTVFDKFAFLNQPNPMMDRHEDNSPATEGKVEDQVGGKVNAAAAGLGGLGLFV